MVALAAVDEGGGVRIEATAQWCLKCGADAIARSIRLAL